LAFGLVVGRVDLVIRLSSSAYLALLIALVAAFVVGYLLFRAGGTGLQSYRLAGQEQQVRREIAELQRQHDELVVLREYLRSDEYIESVARRVLGLVKPGETLTIVSGPQGEEAGVSAEQSNRPNQPWWEALFGP
jgi:cell division protein FtsB